MKFSKSELDIICQYAAPTKEKTIAGMKETVPVLEKKDSLLEKAIVENAIRIPERKAQRTGGGNQDQEPCRRR